MMVFHSIRERERDKEREREIDRERERKIIYRTTLLLILAF